MKKITGILGVAVMVAVMFFNTNNVSSSGSDVSLYRLMNITNAQAEPGDEKLFDPTDCSYTDNRGKKISATEFCCSSGGDGCTYQACTDDVVIRR